MSLPLHIVILAAGCGKRMYSSEPKVLHRLAGKPLLAHVIETALSLAPQTIHVIYGHQGEKVQQELADYPVQWVKQTQQLGTAHAVAQALPYISDAAQVLVLYGDVPLIKAATLNALLTQRGDKTLTLLTANVNEPAGLGRIIRDAKGNITNIIEHKDANPQQLAIHEIFSGILTVSAQALKRWIPLLDNQNAQQEYYLPQIVVHALAEQFNVIGTPVLDPMEVQGINDRAQLNMLERYYQQSLAEQLMKSGVTVLDAKRLDVRGTLTCGTDVTIDINAIFEGKNQLGNHCYIGPNCIIKDSVLGDHITVVANSIIEGCKIADHCTIGPFARLRTGNVLHPHAKIGNFVEIKKSTIGEGSKVNHLSYIGDTTMGRDVNIGAGTITCNYDGVNKHQTIIEDGVNIGSDTQLIAPVTVGAYATIAAGATVRKNAPAEQLTMNDTKQISRAWKRPQKKED